MLSQKEFDEVASRTSSVIDEQGHNLVRCNEYRLATAVFLGFKLLAYAVYAIAQAIRERPAPSRFVHGTGPL